MSLKKLNGVESVKVSLNEGKARIRLKAGNKLSLEQIRDVVNDKGFTPREARVTVQGNVRSTAGKLQMEVTGVGTTYDLSLVPTAQKSRAEIQKLVGKPVLAEGLIVPAKTKKASELLELFNFKFASE